MIVVLNYWSENFFRHTMHLKFSVVNITEPTGNAFSKQVSNRVQQSVVKLLRGYLKRLCPFILLIISLQILIPNFCNFFSIRYFSVLCARNCIKIRFGEKIFLSGLIRYMDAHDDRLELGTATTFHSFMYDLPIHVPKFNHSFFVYLWKLSFCSHIFKWKLL